MSGEFPANLGETIHDVSVVNSQNVTFNQTQIIQISVAEIKTRKFIITSPYKGLKKFEVEDKERFFGRDQFLTELVNELEQTNFVLLLGASGSGKSSVIRAGLIPWLAERQGSQFVNLTFTPDQDPFESLYASLVGKYTQSQAKIARVAKDDTLMQVVHSLKQPNSYWFILIDQFEELFFSTIQTNQRDIFIASLVQLVKTLEKVGDRSVKIVATMRADFLDKLSPYPALVKATDKHRPMIAEMQLDELRLAIEQPAAHHGVVFEAGLVKEIIDDVQGQAGYLPLLQYTLNLLWETEVQSGSIQDRTLNISNYRNLGGVRGALQKHVDQIYVTLLSEPEKVAAQKIFLKLVGIGENEESGTDWRPVRRRANRSEFSDSLEQNVLTLLINQNLLVSNRGKDSQESIIEIAHEALLTSWTTLNSWIKDNRQAIALRNRLNDDVAQWQKTKSNDDLWSGSKLEKILELRQNDTFNKVLGGLSQDANQFLDKSQVERERLQKADLRRMQLTAVAAVTVALVLGVFWFNSERLWQEAQLREDIANSKNLLSIEPTKGLALAIRSVGKTQISQFSNLLGTAESSLFSVLNASREANILRGHQGIITVVTVSKEKLIASADSAGTICLWNRQLNNQLACQIFKGHQGAVLSIGFSPDGKNLVSGGEDGKMLLWNVEKQTFRPLGDFKHPVRTVIFNPVTPNLLYAGRDNGDDSILEAWNINQNQQNSIEIEKRIGHIQAISVSPDGKALAAGGDGCVLRLWDLEKLDTQPKKVCLFGSLEELTDEPAMGHITSIAFVRTEYNSTAKTIVAGSSIGNFPYRETIHIWNLDDPNIVNIKAHEFNAYSVVFNPKNNQILSGGDDATIRAYNLDGEAIGTPLLGHKLNDKLGELLERNNQTYREVNSIALSPDNSFIVSGGSDGTVRIWDSEAFPGIRKAEVVEKIQGYNEKFSVNLYEELNDPIRVIQPENGWFEIIPKGTSLLLQEIPDAKVTPKPTIKDAQLFYSDDGKYLASLTQKHQIQILNSQGNPIAPAFSIAEEVSLIALSPDSQRLVIVNAQNELDVRDFKGHSINRPFAHEDIVHSIAMSPDGQRLVTASSKGMPQGGGDSVIRLWDIQGTLLMKFDQAGALFLNCPYDCFLKFSPSGQSIFSYSFINSLSFHVLPGNWQTAVSIACHRLAEHPMLNDPKILEQDNIAKGAREACEKYSPDWQTKR